MSEDNTDECVRLDTRLAGQVRRYHTWPIIGQQTIAEHCWNLMRIYLACVDSVDQHMVRQIMFHDIGEHFTGDIPYPIKRDNPQLKEQIEFLEQRAICAQLYYWDTFEPLFLTDKDKKLFKQIELVEMAEFGMDQILLGNKHGMIIADRCLQTVYENEPPPRLAAYVKRRLMLYSRQCGIEDDADGEWWLIYNWERLHANGKSETSGRDPL